MKLKTTYCIHIFFFLASFSFYGQSNLSVELNDPVYLLLEISEIKGIISNLSQVRPYSKSKIHSLLNKINKNSSGLSSYEKEILEHELKKYSEEEDRENTLLNVFQKGKVNFNNSPDSLFPMSVGAAFDFELRGDASTGNFHSTNNMEGYLKGDISSIFSYKLLLGAGLNTINTLAFSPFTYSKYSDGYLINISRGLNGGGLGSGDRVGTSFSFKFEPEFVLNLYEDKVLIDFSRKRRDIGNGDGNMSLSKSARPYDAVGINFNPTSWFNFYYSFGSLGDWINGSLRSADDNHNGIFEDNELISQNMFTIQTFEIMPFKWLYLSLTNAAVWGKRFELAYMIPFMMPMFAQNLLGDQDNVALEISFAFKIPIGLKIYGNIFLDELRINENLFADPSQQIGLQAGIRWVIPGLPFTMASFQYTKIEPYAYTHYAQPYTFFDKDLLYDVSWSNDGENLGYHLPPNSDEFLLKISSLAYKDLTIFVQYQYIRHGHGNWEEGQMEGSIDSGGTLAEAHAYDGNNRKSFLFDGIYEKIHIASIGASYQFENIPLKLELDYALAIAENYKNISGNSRLKNVLGLKIHLFPGL